METPRDAPWEKKRARKSFTAGKSLKRGRAQSAHPGKKLKGGRKATKRAKKGGKKRRAQSSNVKGIRSQTSAELLDVSSGSHMRGMIYQQTPKS